MIRVPIFSKCTCASPPPRRLVPVRFSSAQKLPLLLSAAEIRALDGVQLGALIAIKVPSKPELSGFFYAFCIDGLRFPAWIRMYFTAFFSQLGEKPGIAPLFRSLTYWANSLKSTPGLTPPGAQSFLFVLRTFLGYRNVISKLWMAIRASRAKAPS